MTDIWVTRIRLVVPREWQIRSPVRDGPMKWGIMFESFGTSLREALVLNSTDPRIPHYFGASFEKDGVPKGTHPKQG